MELYYDTGSLSAYFTSNVTDAPMSAEYQINGRDDRTLKGTCTLKNVSTDWRPDEERELAPNHGAAAH
jgi:hypothetical protein